MECSAAAGLPQLRRRLLGAESVAAEALGLLEGFAGSQACARIAGAKILGREVPFSVPSEGAVLVGRIDLLLEEAGTTWVLDYKTGEGDLATKYREQLQAYVEALAKNGISARAGVIAIRTGEWLE